jgi:ribosomal protein S12 methylthiotransferase accessory factor
VLSSIGEGLERYSASRWDAARLTRASADDLGAAALDPRLLVLYEDEQYQQPDFPYTPFGSDAPFDWTEGRWLDTGEPVQLPAQATFMNFPAVRSEQFAQTTSNGLAAGATFADAALRALYELIERDAFMLFWLAQLPGVRLAEEGCDPITARALREVERLGARTELYLLDAGTRHPTVVCIGLGNGRSWPGVTVGLAAHADLNVALQRAVLEHGHYGPYIRRLMREGRHASITARNDVRNSLDHALYYIPPVRAAALAPLRRNADSPVAIADQRSRYSLQPDLPASVAALQAAGIRIAAADVTSPDVALAPVCVVRTLGTSMQPIHFGFANRRLRNPRLTALLTGPAELEPHPIA